MAVKVCNCKRPYWGYGLTNATAAGNDQLPCDGTRSGYNQVQLGDEITIMEGANAGQVRHVTNIANSGLSSQIIQLDSALPNLTESSVHFNITPFKLLSKQTLTSLTQLRDLWFTVKNSFQGKMFLVKIVIDGINVVAPEIRSTTLIYNDLGVI